MRDQAIQDCARWLQACLGFGWRHEDLDWLEALWWKYHDEHGRLIEAAPASQEDSQ